MISEAYIYKYIFYTIANPLLQEFHNVFLPVKTFPLEKKSFMAFHGSMLHTATWGVLKSSITTSLFGWAELMVKRSSEPRWRPHGTRSSLYDPLIVAHQIESGFSTQHLTLWAVWLKIPTTLLKPIILWRNSHLLFTPVYTVYFGCQVGSDTFRWSIITLQVSNINLDFYTHVTLEQMRVPPGESSSARPHDNKRKKTSPTQNPSRPVPTVCLLVALRFSWWFECHAWVTSQHACTA